MSRKRKLKPQPLSDEAYAALIASVSRPKSDEEKDFIRKGWRLLEHRFRYYKMDDPSVSDGEYDRLEREYLALANKLGLPASACDMVDYDMRRPSCQLVADRVQGRDPPKPLDPVEPSPAIAQYGDVLIRK